MVFRVKLRQHVSVITWPIHWQINQAYGTVFSEQTAIIQISKKELLHQWIHHCSHKVHQWRKSRVSSLQFKTLHSTYLLILFSQLRPWFPNYHALAHEVFPSSICNKRRKTIILQFSQVFKVKISNTITVFTEICTAITKLANGSEVLAMHVKDSWFAPRKLITCNHHFAELEHHNAYSLTLSGWALECNQASANSCLKISVVYLMITYVHAHMNTHTHMHAKCITLFFKYLKIKNNISAKYA